MRLIRFLSVKTTHRVTKFGTVWISTYKYVWKYTSLVWNFSTKIMIQRFRDLNDWKSGYVYVDILFYDFTAHLRPASTVFCLRVSFTFEHVWKSDNKICLILNTRKSETSEPSFCPVLIWLFDLKGVFQISVSALRIFEYFFYTKAIIVCFLSFL